MVGVSSPPPKPRDGGTAPRGVCGPGAGSPLGRRPQAPVGGGAGGGLLVRRSHAPLGALGHETGLNFLRRRVYSEEREASSVLSTSRVIVSDLHSMARCVFLFFTLSPTQLLCLARRSNILALALGFAKDTSDERSQSEVL